MFDFSKLKQAPFGIKQEYTFYQDFQIADMVGGETGVRDTYKRVKKHWASDPQAWGEVTCALNWRLFDLHKTNENIARLYQELFEDSQEVGREYCDKDREYSRIYFAVTD